jgi:ABC-2 type transport system permease protein
MTQATVTERPGGPRQAGAQRTPGTISLFVGLKLRLLANIFRRSPWQVVGIVIGLVYGLGLAALLFTALVGFRFVDDIAFLRDAIVVAGSATVVGFIVFPLLFGVDDTMDPRKFALFGLPGRRLAIALGAAALIGIPAIVLGIVLLGTVVTWSRGVGETVLAILAAAIAFLTCMLLARAATAVASFLLATRRARELLGVLGLLLIVVL